MLIDEVLLIDVMAGVWCATCATRIIGPFSLSEIINSYKYVVQFSDHFKHFSDYERDPLTLSETVITAYTANSYM